MPIDFASAVPDTAPTKGIDFASAVPDTADDYLHIPVPGTSAAAAPAPVAPASAQTPAQKAQAMLSRPEYVFDNGKTALENTEDLGGRLMESAAAVPMIAGEEAIAQFAGPALASGVRGVGNIAKSGAKTAGSLVDRMKGILSSGKAEMMEKSASEGVSKEFGRVGADNEAKVLDAKKTEIRLQKIQTRLSGSTSIKSIGDTIRQGWNESVATGKAARAENAGQEAYAKMLDTSRQKEAYGKHVDTSEIVKDLENELRMTPDKAEKQAAIEKTLAGFKGAEGKPAAYETLDQHRRSLNELAKADSKQNGAGSMAGTMYKSTAQKLREALDLHSPWGAEYRAKYGEFSEPLNATTTKMGKAIVKTEGGLGDAFAATSPEKIPGLVFSSTENIEKLVHTLAGGQHAPLEDKAKAEKTVQDMAFKYFQEITRQKTPEAALKHLDSPAIRSVLDRLPDTNKRLTTRLEIQGSIQAKLEEAAAKTKSLKALKENMAEDLRQADVKGDFKSYMTIIEKARNAKVDGVKGKLVSAEAYDAAVNAMKAITSEKERVARARTYAKWIGGGAFLTATGGVIGKESFGKMTGL